MPSPGNSDTQEYVPVRVSTLRPGAAIPFSAFVHYKDRYLEYKKPQEILTEDLLSKLKSKKIKKIFINAADEPLYLKYLDDALGQLRQENVKLEDKAEFASETMTSEAENIERNLDTEEAYQASSKRIEKVIEFVAFEKGGLKAMLTAAGVSVDNSQHSSTVASLAVSLAARLELTDKDELLSISLAALIHDNGLKKLGLNPAVLPENLSSDEKKQYLKHSALSVEMVAGKKYITPRVLRLVADHHEVGDGLGFPEKKRLSKLPLSSQIFNLVDSFDHFCMSQQLLPRDAIGPFCEKYEKSFDLSQMAALEQVI